jgi:hypothetical protein
MDEQTPAADLAPAGHGGTRLRLVVGLGIAVLAGLLGSGVLVWRGTSALFTATTTSPGNSWTAGTVALADDDSGTALFTAAGLVPGAQDENCLTVDYTGDVATAVKLYATSFTDGGSLAQYLHLVIQEGSGGGYGDCTGFVPSAGIWTGTLDAFAAGATDYASGVGGWAPSGAASTVYRVAWTLDAATPTSMQGASTGLTFRWESRA